MNKLFLRIFVWKHLNWQTYGTLHLGWKPWLERWLARLSSRAENKHLIGFGASPYSQLVSVIFNSKTCSVNSVVASLEFHHFLSEHNLKKIRFIQVGPVAFIPWGNVLAPISKVGWNLLHGLVVKLRHIAIDIGSVKTCFQEQAGWWLRFDLDNTAVSIFVDILVELTITVHVNSTNICVYKYWDGSVV